MRGAEPIKPRPSNRPIDQSVRRDHPRGHRQTVSSDEPFRSSRPPFACPCSSTTLATNMLLGGRIHPAPTGRSQLRKRSRPLRRPGDARDSPISGLAEAVAVGRRPAIARRAHFPATLGPAPTSDWARCAPLRRQDRSPATAHKRRASRGSRDRQRSDAGREAANGARDALPARKRAARRDSTALLSTRTRSTGPARGRGGITVVPCGCCRCPISCPRPGRARTRGPLEHGGRRQRSWQPTPAPPRVRARR